MDLKRTILFAAFAVLAISLWNAWMTEHPVAPAPTVQSAAVSNNPPVNGASVTPTPTPPGSSSPPVATPALSPQVPETAANTARLQATPADRLVTLRTDLLEVKIDKLGGNIVQAHLLKYAVSMDDKAPVILLSDDPDHYNILQTGVVTVQKEGTKTEPVSFVAAQSEYALLPQSDAVAVELRGVTPSGITLVKTITIKRNDYVIHVNQNLQNNSKQAWTGAFFSQLQRLGAVSDDGHFGFAFHTFTGGAISSPEKRYEQLTFKKLEKTPLSRDILGGWVALQEHYFLSAIVPFPAQSNHYFSSALPITESNGTVNTLYTLGYTSPLQTLAPNAAISQTTTLYTGPESVERLSQVAPGLDLTIDYGWLWLLSKGIFWLMAQINAVIGNWGWSIVLVTLIIKLLFYKLTQKSFHSMMKMRDLQPRMEAIKERFAHDKQKLNQATMELYQKEKINPLGGCLPILIQIPVLTALYYVLVESVELRHAPFMFWIQDLSAKDPFYVLPVLMGISMFIQQKLSPSSPDPMQAKMMMILPLVMTVFFLSFPSGLVLYWLVNNCGSILQQWYVMVQFHKKKK